MFAVQLLSPHPGGDNPDPERVKALLMKALGYALWRVDRFGSPTSSGWSDEDYNLMRQLLYVNEG